MCLCSRLGPAPDGVLTGQKDKSSFWKLGCCVKRKDVGDSIMGDGTCGVDDATVRALHTKQQNRYVVSYAPVGVRKAGVQDGAECLPGFPHC